MIRMFLFYYISNKPEHYLLQFFLFCLMHKYFSVIIDNNGQNVFSRHVNTRII